MQPIPDYPIFDFSGGVRTDRSTYQLKDNELEFAVNADLDVGSMSKRGGAKQFGGFDDAPNANEKFQYGYYNRTLKLFLMANKNVSAQNGMVYRLRTAALTTAITTASTTIVADGLGGFGTNGTVEIEGDIITYTGNTTAALTGVTGITSSHAVGASIRQWRDVYASATNTDDGVWFTFLNNLAVISRGVRGADTYDGTTVTNIHSANAPRFIVTYKQRVYGVGQGTSNQSRVNFSNLTDPSDLTAGGNFDVEDGRGEPIVNLKSYAGRLVMFKPNSTFYYDLSVLEQANYQVGTYNDRTVQEINGLLYTYCPRGVFATNTSDFKEIGRPVRRFIKASSPSKFPPRTGRIGDKFVIYLGDMTLDGVSYTDLAVVYDTVLRNWTVWSELTNLQGFVSFESIQDNYDIVNDIEPGLDIPQLFWGDDSQHFYRMFNERTFYKSANQDMDSGTASGKDIVSDRFQDTGEALPFEARTKLYTLKSPGWVKRFGYVRVLAASWPFQVSARVLNADGFSNWKPLGQVRGANVVFLVDMDGYGIQLHFHESSKNDPLEVNGFIFEKNFAISREHR